MHYRKYTRTILAATLSLSTYILPVAVVQGQEIEFADDFTQDSVRFSLGTFDDSSGILSATPASDGLLLSTTALDNNTSGILYLEIQDRSDSMGMDLTHLSTSTFGGEESVINSYLEAILYSDNSETSDQNRDGDTWADISFGYDQSMQPGVFYCLSRENEVGDRIELPNACGFMEGVDVAIDERTALQFSLDRDSGEVTFLPMILLYPLILRVKYSHPVVSSKEYICVQMVVQQLQKLCFMKCVWAMKLSILQPIRLWWIGISRILNPALLLKF